MATIIINENIKAGKLFIEFLKSQPWAQIVEKEKQPNKRTVQAIRDAKQNKVLKAKSTAELFNKLGI